MLYKLPRLYKHFHAAGRHLIVKNVPLIPNVLFQKRKQEAWDKHGKQMENR